MVPTLAHASAPSNGCRSRRPKQHDCGRCVTEANDCNHFITASWIWIPGMLQQIWGNYCNAYLCCCHVVYFHPIYNPKRWPMFWIHVYVFHFNTSHHPISPLQLLGLNAPMFVLWPLDFYQIWMKRKLWMCRMDNWFNVESCTCCSSCVWLRMAELPCMITIPSMYRRCFFLWRKNISFCIASCLCTVNFCVHLLVGWSKKTDTITVVARQWLIVDARGSCDELQTILKRVIQELHYNRSILENPVQGNAVLGAI